MQIRLGYTGSLWKVCRLWGNKWNYDLYLDTEYQKSTLYLLHTEGEDFQ